MINTIRAFTFLLLICGISASTVADDAKQPAPLPIDEMRATTYTKAFAKRFGLPDPQPDTEPEGGVQAMEFGVEDAKEKYPHKRFATYQCILKLYVDSGLPIAYPEEGVAGTQRLLIRPSHFFLWPNPDNKRWLSVSEKDRQHFGERAGRYTNHVWLATPDYPGYFEERPKKPYAAVGMFYDEYHRDLFPGLAYLKIDMACPAYSWVDKVDVVQVWLKREGAKDYRKQLRKDPQDFLKFTLPVAFYKQISRWTKQAAAYNSQVINNQQREQRKKASP